MLNPAHKHAFLQALDGVDQEIDRLTLGSKQHTQTARAALDDEKSELKPDDEAAEQAAGVDPRTGEVNPEKVHYKQGADYEGKGDPGGHANHPFGQRGVNSMSGMSRKPLFGKRFAR